jgi:predicted Zn-dependent protease
MTLALAACTTVATDAPNIAPGYRPTKSSDEGGIWQSVEKIEAEVKRSRLLVRDPALNAYVHDVACRLAGDHCPDMRVYIQRVPYFNASMYPNGMMQVWTGLLLRSANEAQLAAVLGHELGHYIRQHSLKKWQDVRAKLDFSVFLSMGLALAGAPAGSADLVNFALIASIFAYNRDQEREADEIGVSLMAKAGYEPSQAAKIWDQIIAEEAADPDKNRPSIFFSTHPHPEERADTLRARSAALSSVGQSDHGARYRERLKSIRMMLFEDELRLRQFPRTIIVLDRLAGAAPRDPDLHYFYGELYRARDEGGDLVRAREAYERSIAAGDAPAVAWRGLGLVLRKQGDRRRSSEALKVYLERSPNAPDRALLQAYVTEAAPQ